MLWAAKEVFPSSKLLKRENGSREGGNSEEKHIIKANWVM